jgi:hypothetical protein
MKRSLVAMTVGLTSFTTLLFELTQILLPLAVCLGIVAGEGWAGRRCFGQRRNPGPGGLTAGANESAHRPRRPRFPVERLTG